MIVRVEVPVPVIEEDEKEAAMPAGTENVSNTVPENPYMLFSEIVLAPEKPGSKLMLDGVRTRAKSWKVRLNVPSLV